MLGSITYITFCKCFYPKGVRFRKILKLKIKKNRFVAVVSFSAQEAAESAEAGSLFHDLGTTQPKNLAQSLLLGVVRTTRHQV